MWARWALAALIVALAAMPVVLRYLVFWPLDQWQVDVEVYRQAGSRSSRASDLSGDDRGAATVALHLPTLRGDPSLPLALVPFGMAGWAWTLAQVLATTAITWYAARPFSSASAPGPGRPAALAAPMLWLHPVSDGIRFGQVNAFLVLACLMDLVRPRPRLLARGAGGRARRAGDGDQVDAGCLRHPLPCLSALQGGGDRRRDRGGRHAGDLAGAAPGVLRLLGWGAAGSRAPLGPNAGTANQAIRGVLLRIGPDGLVGTALWLVLAGTVAVLGFGLARRFHVAGASVAEVATVGIVARLISPVSWVHHYHWVVVVIPRAARCRSAARALAVVCRERRHRLVPLPVAVVGHLLVEPSGLAQAAGSAVAERRHGRWGPRAGAALAAVAAVCRAGWLSRRRLR